MGLELHHATRHTYIHTNIYIYICRYIYIYIGVGMQRKSVVIATRGGGLGPLPPRGSPPPQSGGQNQKKAHKWARWLHNPIGRLRRPLAPWAHTFDN